jgi:dCTP deaminase
VILTGPQIQAEVEQKNITIDPFCPKQLNPNSYNFRLGRTLMKYKHHELDAYKPNETISWEMEDDGYVLQPNELVLGHIEEHIGSDMYVPIIKGRSSIGRLGIFIVITADLVDQGAFGQWTMMLSVVQPVRVYPGMLIGQMTFWVPYGEPMLYEGKYQGAKGPGVSLGWRDIS